MCLVNLFLCSKSSLLNLVNNNILESGQNPAGPDQASNQQHLVHHCCSTHLSSLQRSARQHSPGTHHHHQTQDYDHHFHCRSYSRTFSRVPCLSQARTMSLTQVLRMVQVLDPQHLQLMTLLTRAGKHQHLNW